MNENPNPVKKGMSTWKIILLVLLGLFILGRFGKKNANYPSPSPVSATDVRVPEHAGVTLLTYNSLKEGMSYKQAVAILGEEGEEISSNTIGGTKTVMYKWKGPMLGANMNAMFQKGKLVSKAQHGLK